MRGGHWRSAAQALLRRRAVVGRIRVAAPSARLCQTAQSSQPKTSHPAAPDKQPPPLSCLRRAMTILLMSSRRHDGLTVESEKAHTGACSTEAGTGSSLVWGWFGVSKVERTSSYTQLTTAPSTLPSARSSVEDEELALMRRAGIAMVDSLFLLLPPQRRHFGPVPSYYA